MMILSGFTVGANRRNKHFESRRFAPCYTLAADPVYLSLFDEYQKGKPPHTKAGREQHDRHVENIRKIRDYVKGEHKP